jgi:MoaA/NifB/PqqE/SkfB family radical SAM enzyme
MDKETVIFNPRYCMYTKPTLWAEVDEQGRLVLPPEIRQTYGLQPGARLRLDEGRNDVRLHRPVTHLAKVYVEPTTYCNLDCRTCIRHHWDETLGSMSEETFASLFSGLGDFSPPPTVFFGGLGEPLANPSTIKWVGEAKSLGANVELITNGTLLNEKRARGLIEAGLDALWVSIDGATPESYSDVRLGDELPRVIENLERFRRLRGGGHFPKPEIGIAFVAMRRNINELPKVIALGKHLGAKRFMASNVLPYTEELIGETLYNHILRNITYLPSPFHASLRLPRMDIDETTQEAFFQALNSGCNVELNGYNLGGANDVCIFIEGGALAIGWDGSVSPCPPLLHNHTSYLHGKERVTRRHVIGNIKECSLNDLWNDEAYVAYRERVQSFAFAPCSPCGGCDLSEANEEDCFGIPHPACGGCLWAQGVIQCP